MTTRDKDSSSSSASSFDPVSDREADAPIHQQQVNKQANDYVRRFNRLAEDGGFDLPIEVLFPLVELFEEAMSIEFEPPRAAAGLWAAQTRL